MTERWTGSAAICINRENRLLMVLQGVDQTRPAIHQSHFER